MSYHLKKNCVDILQKFSFCVSWEKKLQQTILEQDEGE